LDSPLSVGFKGNPNVGTVVLGEMIEGADWFKAFKQHCEKDDRIFIISSIFGGTGASGYPLLEKKIKGAASQPAVKNFEGSLYNNTEEEILNNINILEDKKENKQIINKGSNLTALQALEILKTNLNSEVYETLKNFIQMRKTIKKPITGYALRLLVDKLKRMTTDPQEQINILNRSILNSWQDIFDPNERKPRQPQPNRYDRPAEPEEDDVIERLKAKYKAEEEAKKRAEGGL
jgi:hypothetical protein